MFRPLRLLNDSKTVSLNGQLKRGFHYAILPSQTGLCRYIITVNHGELRLNHMAYNPDGGTWSCPPQNRQQAHYDLKQGEKYEIQLVIGESFNKPDIVVIVNKSMLNGAEFSYIFKYGGDESKI
ncbi:MAG TPA: hypothetical protein PK733_01975 [Clostridiales bacterium]|nr:hypothetical protein [Clostridiales bacterium]